MILASPTGLFSFLQIFLMYTLYKQSHCEFFHLVWKGSISRSLECFYLKCHGKKITLLWICLEALKRPSLFSFVFHCRDDRSLSSVKNFSPLWLGGLCWLAKYSVITGRNCIFFPPRSLGPSSEVAHFVAFIICGFLCRMWYIPVSLKLQSICKNKF